MRGFCGSLIHGTRRFDSQIGRHMENYLNFEGTNEFQKINILEIRSLWTKNYFSYYWSK